MWCFSIYRGGGNIAAGVIFGSPSRIWAKSIGRINADTPDFRDGNDSGAKSEPPFRRWAEAASRRVRRSAGPVGAADEPPLKAAGLRE